MENSLSPTESKAVARIVNSSVITELTYKEILSRKPAKSIVRYHKFGKFNYLPITAVERLLDGLFAGWKVEMLREGQVANGFYVVVRLTANIPNSTKQLVSEGIGFAEFQTSKGAAPTDFTKLIQGAGVLAIPRARAEAIKNAAKSFGNLFGRNLTRDDENEIAEAEVVDTARAKIAQTLEANNG